MKVIDAVIEKTQNSMNYQPIPIDELELCVNILVVDAFIRCKIFKILRIIIMLLPDNIHPEDSIYFNASYILNELSSVKVVI